MCHASDFDEVPAYKPLYELAAPGQRRRYCKTPSEAKFWREAQECPKEWVLQPTKVNGGVVVVKLTIAA